MKELAVRVKAIRTKKGLTQEEMAEKLGMNQSHYAKLENGKVEIKMDRLTKIASIFEMKVGDLIVFDENTELEKDALFYYYEWKNAIAEIDKLKNEIESNEESNNRYYDLKVTEVEELEDKITKLRKDLKSKTDELEKAINERNNTIIMKDKLLEEKERTIQMMQKFIDSLLNKQ